MKSQRSIYMKVKKTYNDTVFHLTAYADENGFIRYSMINNSRTPMSLVNVFSREIMADLPQYADHGWQYALIEVAGREDQIVTWAIPDLIDLHDMGVVLV